MGLMTEPAWDSNPGRLSKTDFHQENLRHLKKLQQVRAKNGDSKSRQPVKAFALPESGSKKYGPVQPRLYDWTMSGNGPDPNGIPNGYPGESNGRTSPSIASKKSNYSHVQSRVHEWSSEPPERGSKPFLRGHEKTGPFLPSSAGSVVTVRRHRPGRDVGHDYESVADDEIHLAMAPPSSRFGEISIDERRRRIQFIVSEIYSVTPLCKENVTQKTLEKNLRRAASCDHVSEVGSVRAGSIRPEKLSRHPSNPKLARAPSTSSMISANNVEPLTRAHLRKHEAREHSKHAAGPSHRDFFPGRESQDNSKIRPTVSKSYISPRASSRHRDRSSSPPHERAASRNSRSVPSRPSRSGTPVDADDGQSVIARGTDVDYVNANVESVSTVGHHRRKEVQAAVEAAKVTKASLILPDTYKTGAVPRYLKDRQVPSFIPFNPRCFVLARLWASAARYSLFGDYNGASVLLFVYLKYIGKTRGPRFELFVTWLLLRSALV